MYKGYDCRARVSMNGSFLRDHIPIIAEVEVHGSRTEGGRRIESGPSLSIRAGDAGAIRKLNKEFERLIEEGLEDWDHNQLVIWTANKAKEIAKKRNRKDNPDGWSPLTRLMRLKVKMLGMVLRRLEWNKGMGDCYKTFKETKRNMRLVDLSRREHG